MQIHNLTYRVWHNPVYFTAFGFGAGLAPVAPGTFGTLAAIPLYLLIVWFLSPLSYVIILLLAFLCGVWICDKVSSEMGVGDYGGIVFDEIVGYLLTMWAVPLGLPWLIGGFLLFRLFDIWKPFPISWVDKHIKGGLGIMLDDVLAAIPACLILHGIAYSIIRTTT